MIQISGS